MFCTRTIGHARARLILDGVGLYAGHKLAIYLILIVVGRVFWVFALRKIKHGSRCAAVDGVRLDHRIWPANHLKLRDGVSRCPGRTSKTRRAGSGSVGTADIPDETRQQCRASNAQPRQHKHPPRAGAGVCAGDTCAYRATLLSGCTLAGISTRPHTHRRQRRQRNTTHTQPDQRCRTDPAPSCAATRPHRHI